MDLDTAPKLILIHHVLTELLHEGKRLPLAVEVKINKTNYFPIPYSSVHESNLCKFLKEYSRFCHRKMGSDKNVYAVFQEGLNMTTYLNTILIDRQDVSFLLKILKLMINLTEVN